MVNTHAHSRVPAAVNATKAAELVDSRDIPAVSGPWDPDAQRECDRWNRGEIQKEKNQE